MASNKFFDWRTKLFKDGEMRYMNSVIKPALSDLSSAKTQLKTQYSATLRADPRKAALIDSELRRIDAFEVKLNKHATDVRARFAARKF